jgi:hypothetical protein
MVETVPCRPGASASDGTDDPFPVRFHRPVLVPISLPLFVISLWTPDEALTACEAAPAGPTVLRGATARQRPA